MSAQVLEYPIARRQSVARFRALRAGKGQWPGVRWMPDRAAKRTLIGDIVAHAALAGGVVLAVAVLLL